jgi:hypothetical protein
LVKGEVKYYEIKCFTKDMPREKPVYPRKCNEPLDHRNHGTLDGSC